MINKLIYVNLHHVWSIDSYSGVIVIVVKKHKIMKRKSVLEYDKSELIF